MKGVLHRSKNLRCSGNVGVDELSGSSHELDIGGMRDGEEVLVKKLSQYNEINHSFSVYFCCVSTSGSLTSRRAEPAIG